MDIVNVKKDKIQDIISSMFFQVNEFSIKLIITTKKKWRIKNLFKFFDIKIQVVYEDLN